ncbi:MAG TPA: hypothetical protein VKK19_19170 [Candidatus Dormibacteraeota bacterium]|nr:hypothetical protein [Candidatus Dormibacteraeota bacterium]
MLCHLAAVVAQFPEAVHGTLGELLAVLLLEEVGHQILCIRGAVAEQMVDDHQDAVSHYDDGSVVGVLLPAFEAPILGAKVSAYKRSGS